MRNNFICIEGGEGAGKSTVAYAISKRLGGLGVYTREPGGVKISEQIRNILLDSENTDMDPTTEAMLYAAARKQHLENKIKPALDAGKIVICDRYLMSSLAYQGYARNVGMDKVYSINEQAIGDITPGLTILLDVEPEEGLSRVRNRNDGLTRFDAEDSFFHGKVREGYKEAIKYFDNVITIDTTYKNYHEVFYEAMYYIVDYLTKNNLLKEEDY